MSLMKFVSVGVNSYVSENSVIITRTGTIGVVDRGITLTGRDNDNVNVQFNIQTPAKTHPAYKYTQKCYYNFVIMRSIKRSALSPHFDQDKIYKYKTYTEAFYDIFTLDGDNIILKDQPTINTVEQYAPILEQNANILEQNLLILKQNSLLMEQNNLLLQLLAEKKVPEQADLLQM